MKHRFLLENDFWELNSKKLDKLVNTKEIEITTYDSNNYIKKLQDEIENINNNEEKIDSKRKQFLFIHEKTGVLAFNLASKQKRIVCAVIENEYSSYMTRLHNNSNVGVFNSLSLSVDGIIECIKIFIETEFESGRHTIRLNMLNDKES